MLKQVILMTVTRIYCYLLLRSQGKINEGKRTLKRYSSKAKGKYHFHSLGAYRLCSAHPVHDRLDGVYGVFYGLENDFYQAP